MKLMISVCIVLNLLFIILLIGFKNVVSVINIFEWIFVFILLILKWLIRKFGKKILKVIKVLKVIKYYKFK